MFEIDDKADEWWLSNFGVPDEGPGPVDFTSRDGRTVVAVKRTSSGSRGLHAAVLDLAIYLEQHPHVERACLVLGHTRMSHGRIQEEWNLARSVIRTSIANRLAIIVVEHGVSWVRPDEPAMRKIAAHFERNWNISGDGVSGTLIQTPGHKSYEVIKVLLNRWLSRKGAISITELANEVGCSYPTVRKTLDDPILRNNLRTTSNRSVELQSFPHEAWRELTALSTKLRRAFRFRDRSGERPSPQSLLNRLERAQPAHVAFGGVVSARSWHPNFDLHGIPRIDLLYHAPHGNIDLDFVRKIDPALTQADSNSNSAVLVIHSLVRASSLFVERPGTRMPVADPIETALDLQELSLTVQASQLLSHLRPEVRLA